MRGYISTRARRAPQEAQRRKRIKCRRLKLLAAFLLVLLLQRAVRRRYAPGGAGYGQAQSRFEQRQRDEVEAREAKRRRAARGPPAGASLHQRP